MAIFMQNNGQDYSDTAPDTSQYRFPHLQDTKFPLLENVNVYDYKNDFNYERWNDNTKIHLCNVLWNNDYSNVVKFKDDKERDNYFDSIDTYTVDLTTAFHVAPNGTIKVPIPYQVATRYNYLYIDLPIMTSVEEPLNYESYRRTTRFYYFIEGISQASPSSTILIIAPDNWTTYINNVQIPYLMLERGHAPMSAISVDDYLANPLVNNTYLLAPDFNFGSTDVVKEATFVPVNNGDKYIMFATTMSLSQIKAVTYPPIISGSTTPASFEDTDDYRYGYQFIVNDYEWNLGNYDYNGVETETTTFQSANKAIPNNMTMICCRAESASTMFENMSNIIPYIFKTIKACFMVDETMFVRGESFSFCGATCYEVLPAQDSILADLSLSKDYFGYDNKYSKIAKLYTSPYAIVEVTDNNGNVKEFKIENTSGVKVHQNVALAYPYINIQTYLSGVNGTGTTSYEWKNIENITEQKNMFLDDFGKYLWNWDIPTYALYIKSSNEFKASYGPNQWLDRYNAIQDYKKTARLNNTQCENSYDAANNTKTMTDNSANTEYINATNMNATINTNNVNTSNTNKTNTNATAQTMRDNNLIDRNRNTTNVNTSNLAGTEMTQQNTNNSHSICSKQNDFTLLTTDAENQFTITSGVAHTNANITRSVEGGLGSIGFGNPLGGFGAAISVASNAYEGSASMYATVTKNSTLAAITTATNNLVTNDTVTNNEYAQQRSNLLQTDLKNTNNAASKSMNDNTTDTMDANAARSNTTETGNANRTKTTSDTNATNTRDNTKNNATLNKNVTKSNSRHLRYVQIKNAQVELEQKRIANQQLFRANMLGSPRQYGETAGDATLDAFERRGLQLKIRTQNDSHIAQAGDLMLRYGYALNQVWDVANSGLNLMKHFTYWKASDIWINSGEGVTQDAQRDIQRAFEYGVTVWNNPNEIGKVSIYDN